MTRVCCIQIGQDDRESPDARTARVLAWLEETDADLVVLPELWKGGFFAFDEYGALSEAIDGPLVSALRDTAARRGLHLHLGSFVERAPDGRLFNTAALIEPSGEIALTYRKQHLYGHDSREPELVCPGDRLGLAQTALGRIGLAICYDLRFPELFRALTAGGAELLVLCAAWPAARLEHWLTLTRARAIENQAYVVACAGAGVSGGTALSGNSVVIAPTGELLERGPAHEAAIVADIEIEAVRSARAAFPVLRDRRADLCGAPAIERASHEGALVAGRLSAPSVRR